MFNQLTSNSLSKTTTTSVTLTFWWMVGNKWYLSGTHRWPSWNSPSGLLFFWSQMSRPHCQPLGRKGPYSPTPVLQPKRGQSEEGKAEKEAKCHNLQQQRSLIQWSFTAVFHHQHSTLTFPVPGGPANNTALPAIFFERISSTMIPQAWRVKKVQRYTWISTQVCFGFVASFLDWLFGL